MGPFLMHKVLSPKHHPPLLFSNVKLPSPPKPRGTGPTVWCTAQRFTLYRMDEKKEHLGRAEGGGVHSIFRQTLSGLLCI